MTCAVAKLNKTNISSDQEIEEGSTKILPSVGFINRKMKERDHNAKGKKRLISGDWGLIYNKIKREKKNQSN